MSNKKPRIRDFSLVELYNRYKELIDQVKDRDEAVALGFEIMKDFDAVSLSRGASGLLATLVAMALPGRQLDYMDFYCQNPDEFAAFDSAPLKTTTSD